jgi:hypothetical protein
LSGQRDWTGVLGAVSEDGEEFYCQSDEYITAEHARKFILRRVTNLTKTSSSSSMEHRISGPQRSPNSRNETISNSSGYRRIRPT